MKSLHSVLKNTIKWNLRKLHPKILKSAKQKHHVIKEQFLKRMSYIKVNQFQVISFDETLFLRDQKGNNCLSLFKGG